MIIKRAIPFLLFFAYLAFPAWSETDVQFTLQTFNISPAAGREVIIQPKNLPGVNSSGMVIGDRQAYFCDGTGTFWVSNMQAAAYTCTVLAPPNRTEFSILITSTNLGAINANSCLIADANATWPAASVAWAAIYSDNRYILAAQFGFDTNGHPIGATLSNIQAIVYTAPGYTNLTNFMLTIGLNMTNYALALSTNATNFTLSIGLNETNYALGLSTNSSNFTTLTATQLTNFALLIGQNASNYTLQISTNGSNYAAALSTNGSNFALSIGLAGSNLSYAVGLANTNLSLVLSTNGSNYAAALSTNGSNFALSIGLAGSNLSYAIGLANTNLALVLSTNGSNYAAALSTKGSNFALSIGLAGSNLSYAVGLANTNLSLVLSTNGSNYAAALSTNGSNFALSIGLAGSNLSYAVGLANTNLSLVLSTNGSNYASNLSTNGSNFSLGIGLAGSNLSYAIGLAASNLTYAIGLADTNFTKALGTATTNQFVQTNDSRAVNLANPLNAFGGAMTGTFTGGTNSVIITGGQTAPSVGLLLSNNAVASTGVQQPPGDIQLTGHGWETGTLHSRQVDLRMRQQPLQYVSVNNEPGVIWEFDSQIDNSGWTNDMALDWLGNVTFAGGFTNSGPVQHSYYAGGSNYVGVYDATGNLTVQPPNFFVQTSTNGALLGPSTNFFLTNYIALAAAISNLDNLHYLIRDFGALGGSHDDTAAFQAAANSGYPVAIDTTTNFTISTVYLTNNTHFIGFGSHVTKVGTGNNWAFYSSTNLTNVTVEGLYLDGGGGLTIPSSAGSIGGIYMMSGSTNSSVRNCFITGFTFAGLEVAGNENYVATHKNPVLNIENNVFCYDWIGLDFQSPSGTGAGVGDAEYVHPVNNAPTAATSPPAIFS